MKIAPRAVLSAVLLVALLAACGGGSNKAAVNSSSSSKRSSSTSSSSAVTGEGGPLPQFLSDFDRVCKTQVGFSGASPYGQGGAVHPMVLFEDFRGGDFVESSRTFPEGWVVKEDSNFGDNSELKPVQVIACSKRKDLKPTGKKCDFNSDGTNVTLELVDATYELTAYEALTGTKISQKTLEATTAECPVFATFQAGDTTYVSEPEDDAYINALKDVIQP